MGGDLFHDTQGNGGWRKWARRETETGWSGGAVVAPESLIEEAQRRGKEVG